MPESPVPPSTTKPQAIPVPTQHQPRPSTTRAATLSTLSPFKGRATSQPPGGDRLPANNISSTGSGRASPGLNGNGGAYGVIGGSRIPGRFGSGLPGPGGMRAMSFSAAESRGVGAPTVSRTLSSHIEEHPSRSSQSTSPFPTFSPSSSVSVSPAHLDEPLPLTHSPPRAKANVSRSRSQSLAGGPRPTATERPQMMPMSALENAGAFPRSFERKWSSPPETSSNMSPFARGMPALLGPTEEAAPSDAHSRWLSGARNAWGASIPDNTHRSPLSSSVARALGTGFGVPSYSTVVGGFDNSPTANTNGAGGRSGSSSRRHSVSVLGGLGGRRDMFGEPGGGMSTVTSPPGRGLGPLGFSDEDLLPEKLGNALNLEIDENRRRGIDIELKDGLGRGGREIPISQSLPKFDPTGQRNTGFRASIGGHRDSYTQGAGPGTGTGNSFGSSGELKFGTSPARGRPEQIQSGADEREVSRDSRDGSAKSRFSFDAPSNQQTITQYAPSNRGGSTIGYGSQYGGPPGNQRGVGQVSGNPGYDPRMFGGPPPPSFGGPPFPGGMYQGQGQGQGRPPYPGPGMGPGGPMSPSYPLAQGRPPPGYLGYYSGPSPMHGPGSQAPQGRPPPPPQSAYGSAFSPAAAPFQPHGSSISSYYPQSPTSPNMNLHPNLNPNQHSPSSFSQLSLADLGKGIHIGALPPTTPLYVVTFKAGRRDVFYCPDPTLLISNGDRVIVEADRGSDLGTVVYDQLTPAEVREWQEKQATAALLSGASQHQPPGMAVAAQSSPAKQKPGVTTGELAGLDLPTLLAGVGPGGQLDLSQTTSRGPLAKEIMPKRIFTKSSQGPEEQLRMSEKLRDEHDALVICREKVLQRGLPMVIVDAEYQWDRRKLTFYFRAEKRVDFRDLTKENFRIFKSRIWMSMVARDDPRLGA